MAAVSFVKTDAHACGGCFHQESDPQATVVTGHRMALSISPTQTVLWDQVRYAGSPSEFAWVLPIKPGARLEIGHNAWFEALEAATTTRVLAPRINCAPPPDFSEDYYYPTHDYYDSGCNCGCSDDVASTLFVFGACFAPHD